MIDKKYNEYCASLHHTKLHVNMIEFGPNFCCYLIQGTKDVWKRYRDNKVLCSNGELNFYIWNNLITWAFRASTQQPSQPEYNRPFIFLHNLQKPKKNYGNVCIDDEGWWLARIPLEMHNGSEQLSLLSLVVLLTVYEQNGECFYRKFQGIFKIFRKLSNALKFNQAHIFLFIWGEWIENLFSSNTIFGTISVWCVSSLNWPWSRRRVRRGAWRGPWPRRWQSGSSRTGRYHRQCRQLKQKKSILLFFSVQFSLWHYSYQLWHYEWPNIVSRSLARLVTSFWVTW